MVRETARGVDRGPHDGGADLEGLVPRRGGDRQFEQVLAPLDARHRAQLGAPHPAIGAADSFHLGHDRLQSDLGQTRRVELRRAQTRRDDEGVPAPAMVTHTQVFGAPGGTPEQFHHVGRDREDMRGLGGFSITVSKYLQELLREKFHSDSDVILNGIDFGIFNNPDKKFNERKQILFMDHMLENKNSEAAIETVKKLKTKYPSLRIKCFAMRNYHSLPDYVEFVKDPDDKQIADLYRESDIFLFPSLSEGFGLPPAEAMSCKCALVGNSVAAVPEFAENMVSAILTSPENPEELFKGAEYLLNNEKELNRISLAGYENVRRILNWDTAVDKFESFLKYRNSKCLFPLS